MSSNVSILFLQEPYGLRQPGLLRLLSSCPLGETSVARIETPEGGV